MHANDVSLIVNFKRRRVHVGTLSLIAEHRNVSVGSDVVFLHLIEVEVVNKVSACIHHVISGGALKIDAVCHQIAKQEARACARSSKG